MATPPQCRLQLKSFYNEFALRTEARKKDLILAKNRLLDDKHTFYYKRYATEDYIHRAITNAVSCNNTQCVIFYEVIDQSRCTTTQITNDELVDVFEKPVHNHALSLRNIVENQLSDEFDIALVKNSLYNSVEVVLKWEKM